MELKIQEVTMLRSEQEAGKRKRKKTLLQPSSGESTAVG